MCVVWIVCVIKLKCLATKAQQVRESLWFTLFKNFNVVGVIGEVLIYVTFYYVRDYSCCSFLNNQRAYN